MSLITSFRYATALAVIAVFCAHANAANEPITVWGFQTGTPADLLNSATSPTAPADTGTGTATGVHVDAGSDWSTPAGNGSTESFSANGWAVGDYWQFQTSAVGFNETDFGLIFDQVSSNTGPRDFIVQYKIDAGNFTTIGSQYSVRANAGVVWNQNAELEIDRYEVDLASISGALSNATDVYFRLVDNSTTSAVGGTVANTGTNRVDNFSFVRNFVAPEPPPPPELPIAGDLVLGLGISTPTLSVQLARGPSTAGGGDTAGSPWTQNGFIRSVEFDNKGGTLHNVEGNLLGADEGTIANGGTVYSFATQGNPATFPAGQAIANTRLDPDDIGQDGLGAVTLTRLSGLSVAPNNSKIAVAGMDTGRVLVYDYAAGNSMGAGASASGGRQSAQILDPFVLDSDPGTAGNQSLTYRYGTAWLDDNTVLAFNRDGELHSVNATSMVTALETTVGVPLIGDEHTALAYNPDVSPYLYAMYSGFDPGSDPTSRSRLFIFDPLDDFGLLGQADLTNLDSAGDTAREIALDADGNLFIGTFGSEVYLIPDVVTDPASIATAVSWYESAFFATHTGLDIGFAPPEEDDADYNEDGTIDAADYVTWRKSPGTYGGPGGYDLWKQQFGQPSAGSGGGAGGGAVPEPAGLTLVALGLAALCLRRRSA